MFNNKRCNIDVKKVIPKIIDGKKDLIIRFKHLRLLLENVEGDEATSFFESHFSSAYYLFYEYFVSVETNLKQRGYRAHRDELEIALFVLDRILIYCPELISKRWQCNSFSRILAKLLHPSNSWKLRRDAIKYFIMWYQCLGINSPNYAHVMFSTLVPGIPSAMDNTYSSLLPSIATAHTLPDVITPIETQVLYPPQSGEKYPEDEKKYFIDALLEFMTTQIGRIRWKDDCKFHADNCFIFLFESFKKYYLPHIFPDFCYNTNIYKLNLEFPALRESCKPDEFVSCRVSVIKWIANFTHDAKLRPNVSQQPAYLPKTVPTENVSSREDLETKNKEVSSPHERTVSDENAEKSIPVLTFEDSLFKSLQIVRSVLYGSRDNINFIHEVYRQAFLLNFTCSPAIRRTIAVYKDWIQMNISELPPFMLEPIEHYDNSSAENTVSSDESMRSTKTKLRNDSYVGAMFKDNRILLRAGLQAVLKIFITHSANVFFLETSCDYPVLMEEQVDTCKRVLNMYRYMVMHTHMETSTWEQLLEILLRITSVVLRKSEDAPPNKKKEVTLGGRLAPAIFQTLIVTWIKANLNVVISVSLWDKLLDTLSSLTHWEELIKEWAKTMETLTRVLARHVFNLDLMDLPLDRLADNKNKRRRIDAGAAAKKMTLHCDVDNKTANESSNLSGECCEAEDSNENCFPHRDNTKIRRSASECNIAYLSSKHRATDIPDNSASSSTSPVASKKMIKRWKSADSYHFHSKRYGRRSRSASPTASSGIDGSSMKDGAMNIDVITYESSNVEITEEDRRSVMSGGNVRGWLPDVAIVLWKRMLGILGNVNDISIPYLHAQMFHHLSELSNTLTKMYLNVGISDEAQAIAPNLGVTPPITTFVPWCFQALQLPQQFQKGKLHAYKILCEVTMTVAVDKLSKLHIQMFFSSIHQALTSSDKYAMYTVLKYTGSRFFSRQLPGYFLLIKDFALAAQTVIYSNDIANTPRAEAVAILACLLSFTDIMREIPCHRAPSIAADDLKLTILKTLLHAAKKEPSALARCYALSSITIFLYSLLENGTKHTLAKDAYNTLLMALKFNNENVSQVACDNVLLLCEHVNELVHWYPELAPRTIEVLAGTLASMIPIDDEKKRLLTSLIFCLAEWTMRTPLEILLQPRSTNVPVLLSVFKVLDVLANGRQHRSVNVGGHFNPELGKEFVNDVVSDDIKKAEVDRMLLENGAGLSHLNSTKHSIQIAASMIISHLVNHCDHFPMTYGASRLSSLVTEQDDLPLPPKSDQYSSNTHSDPFSRPEVQFFLSSNNYAMSLIELPSLEGTCTMDDFVCAPTQVRVLLRSLDGKYCWDATELYCKRDQLETVGSEKNTDNSKEEKMDAEEPSFYLPSVQQNAMRRRQPHILPTVENSARDLDNLDDLLQYIGHTSPECLESPDVPRNIPSTNSLIPQELEQEVISAIVSQQCAEQEYLRNSIASDYSSPVFEKSANVNRTPMPFAQCRRFFSQMGFLSWEHRSSLHLSQKNEKVSRELRNLDNQLCRETHKIAVIYVAPNQEDKASILENSEGSQQYEDFVAGLGWEVELETHTGFMGGLQKNKSTGVTAPYYATSFVEVIFHVATRMSSSNNEESFINKTRHLGNDEVHIVWSEHSSDYRRGIIQTQFCDILICVYPLPRGLFRVQISKKPEVPFLGPLFNEVIIHQSCLVGMIRATAISASRAKRSVLPFYQHYYEERNRCLETLVRNCVENTTFETYAERVYSPCDLPFDTYNSFFGDSWKTADSYSSDQAQNQDASAFTNISLDSNSAETGECKSSSSHQSAESVVTPHPRKKHVSKSSSRKSVVNTPTPPESPLPRKAK